MASVATSQRRTPNCASVSFQQEDVTVITTTHDDLTRVGPGSLMGNLMRQYWIPAAMSSELEPDGEPMRLVLLGEPLIVPAAWG
jgi:hypothetical protein